MGVAARDHQRQQGKFQLLVSLLPFFQQDGVNVAFQVIHRDERLVEREGQSLGVADPDQQSSGEARPLSNRKSIDRVKGLTSVGQGFANPRHDSAQVLTRSQFRNYSAIGLMGGDL